MTINLFSTLNRTNNTALLQAGVDANLAKRNDAAKKIQTGQSFVTLKGSHDAGVARRLADDRSRLAAVSQHKANNVLAGADNKRQAQLLTDINAEVSRFEGEVISFQDGSLSRTKEQIADDFFDNMEKLINTREGGKYLLNPANPNEKPISGPAGTLKTINNVVDNLATSNYTSAEESLSEIEVGDEASVRTNPLHAGAAFIREYLAMGRNFRNNGPTSATYQASKDAGARAHSIATLNVGNIGDRIKASGEKNINVEAALLEEVESIEGINLPLEAVRLNDATNSIFASFNLTANLNRLDTQLIQAAAAA